MLEVVPDTVDSAFFYFHTRCSTGEEIKPFVSEIQRELPSMYIWAGDGGIEGREDAIMGSAVSSGDTAQRYWFVFPMRSKTTEAFVAATEAMGAILITCGGYVNTSVNRALARFQLPASRVVLCGHQHGACVALAAAMMRRADPFALTLLFDPWPLETLYLQHEQRLPATKVVCIDNLWVQERERRRGATAALFHAFRQYGINAEGITLAEGQGQPDEHMFREAVRQIKATLPDSRSLA
jgi:hypothetical protein